MEPVIPLPLLQVPAACPYPEPDQSSPCPHHTSRRSTLILSSNLRLDLPSGPFPSGFPTKTLYVPLLSQYSTQTLRFDANCFHPPVSALEEGISQLLPCEKQCLYRILTNVKEVLVNFGDTTRVKPLSKVCTLQCLFQA